MQTLHSNPDWRFRSYFVDSAVLQDPYTAGVGIIIASRAKKSKRRAQNFVRDFLAHSLYILPNW